jgi:hypothetical protein
MAGIRRSKLFRDEQGGMTIWSLLWFALFVGISGLAVDTTNGFRNKTMLQATADSAALAAAIDLPNPAAAVATAVSYSADNMTEGLYGEVLAPEDVTIGVWDHPSRTFTPGTLVPDAVLVRLRQTEAGANAVPVNFLRIIGLKSFDVNVQAIAQRFIPDCLKDGLVARGIVDISANNGFVNRMCIHGQKGVHMQNHNFFEDGVDVTMPNPDAQLVIPAPGMESNPGLPQALGEDILDPRMVNHVDEIMDDLLAKAPYVIPGYIDINEDVIVKTDKWNFDDVQEGRIYNIDCAANKTVGIPNNIVLSKVVIVSDCQVSVGSNAFMRDVVLASRAGGNPGQGGSGGSGGGKNSGSGGAGTLNANIGVADNCAPGGGVQIFSNASVQFSSTMTMNGVQIVAAGDVDLGARDMGINGINVQAGGNITLTSNNMFGLCSGGAPDLFTVDYYRLVL